jgi:UDP-glucose 4-epimerase
LERGWRVIGIDAFTDYYESALKRANISKSSQHRSFEFVDGDLLDLDLPLLLRDADLVFHLAAQPGVRASWDQFDTYVRHNLSASQRLLDAARDANLERFVYASSSSIYGDAETLPTTEDVAPRPVSPYGVTKAGTEHLANVYWRNYGVPTVGLRYFTVYGPRQRPDMAFNRMIAAALDDRPFIVFGDGEQTRDFTYVDDAVAGTLAAVRGQPGTAYNIGGGARRSMNDVFRTLGTVLGHPVSLDYREVQTGDARDTAADVTRAQSDLGYVPGTEFRDGLAAQVAWQRAQVGEAVTVDV